MVNLKHLKIIKIYDLKRISCETFKCLVNGETLDLGQCAIEEIEPGAFSSLQKLKVLNLKWNELTKCPSIEGLRSLEDLSYNRIEAIGDTFGNFNSKLTSISLRKNKLKALQEDSFSGRFALRSLNLDFNEADNGVSSNAFTGLANLRHLYLCHTKLTAIDSGLCSPLVCLEKLFLTGTALERIKAGAFSHFRSTPVIVFENNPNSALLKPFEDEKLITICVCKQAM